MFQICCCLTACHFLSNIIVQNSVSFRDHCRWFFSLLGSTPEGICEEREIKNHYVAKPHPIPSLCLTISPASQEKNQKESRDEWALFEGEKNSALCWFLATIFISKSEYKITMRRGESHLRSLPFSFH